MNSDTAFEARALLNAHGLGNGPLTPASGVANDVWLTSDAVIRLNEGRFRDAFRHEARILGLLPASIPHPAVLAYGMREGGGEYLILERVPGRTLDAVWPGLDTGRQRQIVRDLAEIVQRLHALPLVPAMENPWVQDALTIPIPRDAYHAPPERAPMLVSAATVARPDLAELIGATGAFIADRMPAFAADIAESVAFVHADLHFRNVLVDEANGRVTGVIDFEGSRPAAADVELDMLVRFLLSRRQSGAGAASDVAHILVWFREGYPELFAHPRLAARLEVYEALWQLVQIHQWRPESGPSPDPAVALRCLLAGGFHDRLDTLLALSEGHGADAE